MKTVVFIIGTNCAGKSTLARELIERFGGVKSEQGTFTICNDARHCFAGTGYAAATTQCGVDKLHTTTMLADTVKLALTQGDCVFCEGQNLNTIGMNLTNAIFQGEKQLVIFLYASPRILNNRRLARSGKVLNKQMLRKQSGNARAAAKWQKIGVSVVAIDTSDKTPRQIADIVIEKLQAYEI